MAFLPRRLLRPTTVRRGDRGVAFPSPVVMLSVVAVGMAGIAFVATQDQEPAEREITVASRESGPDTPAPAPATVESAEPLERKKKPEPQVVRGDVYVVVFNNSGISGLAAQYSSSASDAGWQVVGADNWYGTIPSSTVYYPPKLKDAAELLALDLGIRRVLPAVEPMNFDRLTVILTADAA